MTIEIILLLLVMLIVGYVAARVIGKLARIGFYVLLGAAISALAWILFTGM